MSDHHSLNDPNDAPPRPNEDPALNNESFNTNRTSTQSQPYTSTDSPALWSFDDIVDLPPSPTPPPPRSAVFLDQILNPGPTPASSSSFFVPSTVFRQDFGFSSRPAADVPGASQTSAYSDTSMPPTRSSRVSRRNSGVVDLTEDTDPPVRRLSAQSGGAGPSAKRRKRSDGGCVPVSKDKKTTAVDIGEVDLTEENTPLKEALEKQRADAVKAQQKPEEKATNFNTLTCVICMDTPTDLTATSCGHIFCHSCLMEALIAGEERSAPGEPRRSQCPVCRKHISRTKQTDIIPLLLMKGLATQPRKKLKTTA